MVEAVKGATWRQAVFVLVIAMSNLVACISKQNLGDTPEVDAGTSACAKHPCTLSEVCYRGECVPRSSTAGTCSREHLRQGIDDCPIDAMCLLGTNDTAHCKLLEPCSATNTCEVGAQGAVCNTGYAPEKADVCLYGYCVAQENCPSGSKCLTTIGTLGFCSNGDPGSPCVTKADCKSGTCAGPGAAFGICF